MSTETFFRLLREHNGNAHDALQHAAASIDYYAGVVSCGYIRARPERPVRAPKLVLPALDIPPAAEGEPP